jgi:hypothetical protein
MKNFDTPKDVLIFVYGERLVVWLHSFHVDLHFPTVFIEKALLPPNEWC